MKQIESDDRGHLKLLAVFHYVMGGMVAAMSIFPIFHVGIGLRILSSADDFSYSEFPSQADIGWIVFAMGLISILIGLAVALCLALSGRSLMKRRRYWFSFVVACVECAFMPLGTVLGALTLCCSMSGISQVFVSPAEQVI